MIKFTGCILLIAACSLMGRIKANTYKDRTKELENVIEIIKHIDMYITYRKEPIAKIFIKVGALKNCWLSSVLEDCAYYMNKQYDLVSSWRSAVKKHIHDTPLIDEDISIIEDLIIGLGKSDSEGQRRVLEPILTRVGSSHKDAVAREKSLGRMYKTLGAAAGVVITILII